MIEKKETAESQDKLIVSSRGKALLTKTFDKVFEAEEGDELRLIENMIKGLDAGKLGSNFEPQRIALESVWNFFDAMGLIKSKADFMNACKKLERASEGFSLIGRTDLRDLSIGLGLYVKAVAEIQSQNVGRAFSLYGEAKEYLEGAGKFSNKFRPLVDAMEPEMLFLAGLNALAALDFAKGRAYIEQASRTSKEVAGRHFKEGDTVYCILQGYAHFYRACYILYVTMHDFNQLEYEKLANEEDLTCDAVEAQKLLRSGEGEAVQVKNAIHISNTIVQLLEVTHELAKIMQRVLKATFKADPGTFKELKEKVNRATKSASETGIQGATFIRFCNEVSDKVNNLERLAKPNKRDFGKFSGLVTCGIFLPLFLIVSFVNFRFSMNLGQQTVVIMSLVPALIGGFGYGAVRFKSIIFPGPSKESSEERKGDQI